MNDRQHSSDDFRQPPLIPNPPSQRTNPKIPKQRIKSTAAAALAIEDIAMSQSTRTNVLLMVTMMKTMTMNQAEARPPPPTLPLLLTRHHRLHGLLQENRRGLNSMEGFTPPIKKWCLPSVKGTVLYWKSLFRRCRL